MTKLKPCPFCGKEAGLEFAHTTFDFTDRNGVPKMSGLFYTVKCVDLFCGCSIGVYEDPNMAIEAWSRRVGEVDDKD